MMGILRSARWLLILGTLFALAPTSLWAQSSPDQLITELTDDLYELIDGNRAAYESDPELLKQAVDERMRQHIDTVYAGRLVLGRHGRGLDTATIEVFAEALGQVLMDQYAERLLDFDSQNKVEVLPLEPDQDPRRTRVRTRLRLDNGAVMPLDYVVRLQDGQWRLFDVIAEGISYVATLRTQIGEQITQQGFDATLASLQAGQLKLEAENP